MSTGWLCRILPRVIPFLVLAAPAATGSSETGPLVPGKDISPYALDPSQWEGGRVRALATWPDAEDDPPVDVLHYDLDLSFDVVAAGLGGTASVTARWRHDTTNDLRLDLVSLPVFQVRHGLGYPLSFLQDTTGLTITVLPPPQTGDTVTVEVDYGGIPAQHFYVGTASYTFTEPEGSRYWFPCVDVPWDKATLSLSGKVPSTLTLVSNGALDSTTVEGDSTTYHWREDHPLATYLMAAAISDYVEVPWASSVAPLSWFVYPADETASKNAFKNVADMLAYYDQLLVPYPFDKYTMCEANFGGGMEHQTCTLMGEVIVQGGLTYEWITAHELAHQWFGDLVTTKGWGHIWLNEGFASFYDVVWHEAFYGEAAFHQRMQLMETNIETWLGKPANIDHPVADPPIESTFSTIVYQKGAWVLRMLRDVVGRSTFDAAVIDYLNAHAFGNAETADFIAAVEAQHGESLAWFFDPWLYGTGKPHLLYETTFSHLPSGWRAQIEVRQAQAGTRFRIPLEVLVTTTGGEVRTTHWVEGDRTVVSIPTADQPLSVTLDPDNKLLGDAVETALVGIPEAPAPSPALAAWPNPFRTNVRLALGDLAAGSAVDIFDIRGRRVQRLKATGPELSWDGRDASGSVVAPGAYFVRVRDSGAVLRIVRLPDR
jgi:aminopeptidase N